jgi:ribonuclease III
MSKPSLKQLQNLIGHEFQDTQILLLALTHSSYARESGGHARDNEQLEFLGDAILSFLVSDYLRKAFPDLGEGKLSRGRARLVEAQNLARIATELRLGDYLRFGRGEEKTGGRTKGALLADAFEALLAAVYEDGGIRAARKVVHRLVIPPDLKSHTDEIFSTDYKSALQEKLQAMHMAAAAYRVVEEKGPQHQKTFTVEAVAGDGLRTFGEGPSKKAAQQQAACGILEILEGKRANG